MVSEIIIILALIIVNGIFSMSEIALVSSRKSALENAANKGDKKARIALELAESPNRFLSTVQVGITLIGILTGVFGGAEITDRLRQYFLQFPATAEYSRGIAVSIVVLLITFFSLVLGELVPKRIGLINSERIAKLMARPMRILSKVAAPIIRLLSVTTDLVIRIFNIKPSDDSKVTEEEIRALIAEGTSTGAIEEVEQDIVGRVFHLGDRRIGSLMTNRMDIVWLDLRDDFDTNRKKIIGNQYSAYPVCDEEIDRVAGILQVKTILEELADGKTFDLRQYLIPALFLPENVRAYKALEKFKEIRGRTGVVVDEYGSVQGLVTLNDLLEALITDVTEAATDEEAEIIEREDGTWLADGLLSYDDFLRYFETEDMEEERGGFHTLAGFILDISKKIPQAGEIYHAGEFDFEIMDMDGNRIDKVLIKRKART